MVKRIYPLKRELAVEPCIGRCKTGAKRSTMACWCRHLLLSPVRSHLGCAPRVLDPLGESVASEMQRAHHRIGKGCRFDTFRGVTDLCPTVVGTLDITC
jgi:hypothetical protein